MPASMIQFASTQALRTVGRPSRVLWDRVTAIQHRRARASVLSLLHGRRSYGGSGRRPSVVADADSGGRGVSGCRRRAFTSSVGSAAGGRPLRAGEKTGETSSGPSERAGSVVGSAPEGTSTGGAGGVLGVLVGLAAAGFGGYYLYETWGKDVLSTATVERGLSRSSSNSHLSTPSFSPSVSSSTLGTFSPSVVKRVSARDELAERQRELKVELEQLRKLKRDKFIDLKKKEIKAELKILSNSIAALDKQ